MTVKLTFVAHDGGEHEVSADVGQSVMEAALSNGVEGITAECNGSAACATCHAIFDEALLVHMPEITEHENDMLDIAATERVAGSRLSCQIPVTDAFNGARIMLPEEQ